MKHAIGLLARDAEHLWHPYAPSKPSSVFAVVEEASGSTLVLDDGNRRIEAVDAMASWWCQLHGYRNPVLDEALHAQVDRFSHVMFGGLTHEPAVRVAEQLVDLAPAGMNRVFLADSGSVAMEVALKFVRQVAICRGSGGLKVAALTGAYHGDTLGAMSVCDPAGGMHAMFADSLPSQIFLPRPPRFGAEAVELDAWASATAQVLDEHEDELCAIVVEPVLQGAGGMWGWSPGALAWLRAQATERGLSLVADEIATGFGRTGQLFACDWANVVPDVLVVGKSMTGGYLTQAAMITTDAFAAELDAGPGGALMHGPTFMGNPLACAASSASLGIIASGAWRDQTAAIADGFERGLGALRELPGVREVRVLGATAASSWRPRSTSRWPPAPPWTTAPGSDPSATSSTRCRPSSSAPTSSSASAVR